MTDHEWDSQIRPMIAELWPKADFTPQQAMTWRAMLVGKPPEHVESSLRAVFSASSWKTPALSSVIKALPPKPTSDDSYGQSMRQERESFVQTDHDIKAAWFDVMRAQSRLKPPAMLGNKDRTPPSDRALVTVASRFASMKLGVDPLALIQNLYQGWDQERFDAAAMKKEPSHSRQMRRQRK